MQTEDNASSSTAMAPRVTSHVAGIGARSAAALQGVAQEAGEVAGKAAEHVQLPKLGKTIDGKAIYGAAGSIAEARQPAQPVKKPATVEDHAIAAGGKVREWAFAAWMPGWMALPKVPLPLPVFAMGAMVMGWFSAGAAKLGLKTIAKGIETPRTAIRMTLEPIPETLGAIQIKNFHELPGQLMRGAANVAKAEPGQKVGKISAKSGESYMRNSASWLEEKAGSVDASMLDIRKRASEASQPLRAGVKDAVKATVRGPVGQWFDKMTSGFTGWRHQRVAGKLPNVIGHAEQSFTQGSRSLWQVITFQKPKAVSMPAEFSAALGHVGSAANMNGAERTETLLKAHDALKETVAELTQRKAADPKNKALVKELDAVIGHGNAILSKVGKAFKVSGKEAHLGEVATGGMEAWLRNMKIRAGNAPLMAGIIATGVAAGGLAAMLSAHRDNRVAGEKLKDFANDVGDDSSALVKKAKSTNRWNAGGRYVNAVLSTAADGMMIGTGSIAEGGHAFAAQMAMMSAGGLLSNENKPLEAHAALKQAERGEVSLEAGDKVEANKQLVGMVPEVAAKGGVWNPLTGATAEALVERGSKVADTMKLLNNTPQFVRFATEVNEKRKADLHAAAANDGAELPVETGHSEPKAVPVAANDDAKETPKLAAANDNPVAKISGVHHHGTIAASHAQMRA